MKKSLLFLLAFLLAFGAALPAAAAEQAAPTTLTVLYNAGQEAAECYAIQKIESLLNVSFEWTFLTAETAKEKFSLMVNTGDLPDIILRPAALAGDVNTLYRYGEEGVFLDLIPELETYEPETLALYQGYAEIYDMCVGPSGKLYFLPSIAEDRDYTSNSVRTYISSSWLENVGMALPTNTEELYQVLKAFKEQDANGNGDPNDEIPWTFDSGTLFMQGLITTAYIELTQADHRILNDGTVGIVETTEEYREALRYVKKLFDEGLLYKESFTQDTNTVWALNELDANVNTLGMVTGGHKNCVCSWDSNRWEDYEQLFLLFDANGETHPSVKMGNNFGAKVSLNAELGEEELRAALSVLAYTASEEGSFLMRFGEFGLNIEQPDEGAVSISGQPAYYKNMETPQENVNMTNDWNYITRLATAQLQVDETIDPRTDWTYYHIGYENKYYHTYVDDLSMYWPTPMIMDVDAVNQIALIQTDLNSYIKAANVDFVTGKRDIDADWDTFLAELDQIGLQDYLSISQAQYDAKYK